MKCLLLISFCFGILCQVVNGQTPGVKWTRYVEVNTFGEFIFDIKPTKDKGFITAGADSVDAPFRGDHLNKYAYGYGNIQKLDSTGNRIWKVNFAGWFNGGVMSVEQTTDKGFIACGFTTKYTPHSDTSVFMVVKLYPDGRREWIKILGGTKADIAYDVIQTNDLGYLVVGKTSSDDGDVSGNHSINNDFDYSYDIWAVKLDASGNFLWKKCFGGTGTENGESVLKLADNGFLIAGTSTSTNGDLTNNKGGVDGWLIKIDMNGELVWQKNYGGSGDDYFKSICAAADGDYVVSGFTTSDDGDITGNHGGNDAWVLKVDANGGIKWSKCFGGSGADYALSVSRSLNSNFLVGGSTTSTDGDVSINNGKSDMWALIISQEGNILWEKTIGTARDEYGTSAASISEHEYIIGGYAESTIPYHHSDYSNSDGLVILLGNASQVKGNVFLDNNSNSIRDPDEVAFDKIIVNFNKGSDKYTVIPDKGKYYADVDTGSYIISTHINTPYYTAVPSKTSFTFPSYSLTDSIDIAVQTIPNIRDMVINLLPITVARPGFNVQYKIEALNAGTSAFINETIKLIKDPRISFLSASILPTTTIADTLYWDISSIAPLEKIAIYINFKISPPPVVNFADTLKLAAIIHITGDETPSDDTSRLKQVVTGSYDPNDKTETNGGIITPEQVASGEHLNYLIRFQNTGTDTAFNVIIRDTLSNMLDWNTLEMISSSHTYNLQITDDNKLSWYFNDILLVDSNTNEPDSHGYIAFRIRPQTSLQVGDTVKNAAGIYFDYNLPVQTNTEKTTVLLEDIVLPVKLENFSAILKDNRYVQLDWQTSYEQNSDYFEVQKSREGIIFERVNQVKAAGLINGSRYSVNDPSPFEGTSYYRLKAVDKDGSFDYSPIKPVSKKTISAVIASLYPNPSNNQVTLKLEGPLKGKSQISITDFTGRRIFYKEVGVLDADKFTIDLDVKQFRQGSYLVQFTIDDKVFNQHLIIQ